MGNLNQATAQALGNAAHNATSAAQNSNTVLQATTTQGVSLDVATKVMPDPDTPD
ncbi:MAG: hypothetical protein GYB36_03085 [Alphaproteobacteria bacterium]|nr:hypothetical protein [Alphaproteobacteria bacterium]